MNDIDSPEAVEILIRSDSKVLWINVDGVCALRCSNIKVLELNDERKQLSTAKEIFGELPSL